MPTGEFSEPSTRYVPPPLAPAPACKPPAAVVPLAKLQRVQVILPPQRNVEFRALQRGLTALCPELDALAWDQQTPDVEIDIAAADGILYLWSEGWVCSYGLPRRFEAGYPTGTFELTETLSYASNRDQPRSGYAELTGQIFLPSGFYLFRVWADRLAFRRVTPKPVTWTAQAQCMSPGYVDNAFAEVELKAIPYQA